MEKFNIELFNRNKDGNNWVYTLSDGTKIRQFEIAGTGYIEDRTPLQSAYTYRTLYDLQGRVITTVKEFYSFFTGVEKHYDGHGNLIKEVSRDEGFAFSVEDLAAKMLADYKVDILNSDNIYKLNRGQNIDPPFSFYQVYCYDLASPAPDQAVIAFLVNGTTGEVLHILHTNTRRPTPVLGAYLERIANTPKEGQ